MKFITECSSISYPCNPLVRFMAGHLANVGQS